MTTKRELYWGEKRKVFGLDIRYQLGNKIEYSFLKIQKQLYKILFFTYNKKCFYIRRKDINPLVNLFTFTTPILGIPTKLSIHLK